jgi:hypothetical protein
MEPEPEPEPQRARTAHEVTDTFASAPVYHGPRRPPHSRRGTLDCRCTPPDPARSRPIAPARLRACAPALRLSSAPPNVPNHVQNQAVAPYGLAGAARADSPRAVGAWTPQARGGAPSGMPISQGGWTDEERGASVAGRLAGHARAVPNAATRHAQTNGLPQLVVEEGAPEPPLSPRAGRMDTSASGVLMPALTSGGGSPNAPDDGSILEGQPMDKLIRVCLAEGEDDEEAEEAEEAEGTPAEGHGGSIGGLTLELCDGEASVTAEENLRAMTPAAGVLHNSIVSPVECPVGKVHAVAGDLHTP